MRIREKIGIVFLLILVFCSLWGCVTEKNEEEDISYSKKINLQDLMYTEIEIENSYPVSNDPLKTGMILDENDKLFDFFGDSRSCDTPAYVYQLTWNDLKIKSHKLYFLNEGLYPQMIRTDSDGNYFIQYPGFISVYNESGKKISRIDIKSSWEAKFFTEDDIIYIVNTLNNEISKINWLKLLRKFFCFAWSVMPSNLSASFLASANMPASSSS